MEISKLASAIYNDIVAGLAGFNANPSISIEQLEDECVEVRNALIKEYWAKGLIYPHELMKAINCIAVDCDDMNKCPCNDLPVKMAKHFEIPPIVDSMGIDAIDYIGATDRSRDFKVYFSLSSAKGHQYKRHGSNDPYVYIECTPNKNGMYDGWVFNAPFIENLSIIAVFRDLRQLEEFNCCGDPADYEDFGSLSNAVKDQIIKKKFTYYRQMYPSPQSNDLNPR